MLSTDQGFRQKASVSCLVCSQHLLTSVESLFTSSRLRAQKNIFYFNGLCIFKQRSFYSVQVSLDELIFFNILGLICVLRSSSAISDPTGRRESVDRYVTHLSLFICLLTSSHLLTCCMEIRGATFQPSLCFRVHP